MTNKSLPEKMASKPLTNPTDVARTQRLSLDNLKTIFLYAVSPPSKPCRMIRPWYRNEEQNLMDIFFPVILAAVCSRWRSVAFSTATLWTHFEFPQVLWTRERVPCHLLSLYLENSKQLPIHLSLFFTEDQEDSVPDDALFHPALDPALTSDLSRIHSLSLHNPPSPWAQQLGKLPQIVDLTIVTRSGLPLPEVYSRIPSQNDVATTTSLTVLELSAIPIDICVKIMLRCPNLVEAYIHGPEDAEDDDLSEEEIIDTWFPQPVIFNHLAILLWWECGFEWAKAFLQQMKTPRLHTLKLSTDHHESEFYVDSLEPLIKKIPQTLKTLELEFIEWMDIKDFGRLCNSESPVEHLILHDCAMDMAPQFLGTSVVEGTSDLAYLPKLKSVSVSIRNSEDLYYLTDTEEEKLEIDYVEPLIKSLERRLSPGDSFRVEFRNFVVDWDEEAQERLQALVETGIHLEVIENANQVDWL